MIRIEKLILKVWGSSAPWQVIFTFHFGLTTIVVAILSMLIAVAGKFWLGVWGVSIIVQAIGFLLATKLRSKYHPT